MAPAKRRRRPYRSWLLGFAAVIVAAMAAAAVVAWRAGYLSRGTPAGPAATSRPQDAATMTALGSYLAQSAAVRPNVQPAIDKVRSCAQSASTGQAAIQQAIDTRLRILDNLQGLSPGGLPGGAQLISTLTAAMRDSVNADRYYQNWMADFASAGSPCGSSPSQNPNFAAGQEASTRATADKNAFVSMWNPLAPAYGQRTYSAAGF